MALTFRDTKGSPLTSDEVDANFRTLEASIDDFVSADGVGIASIEVIGATFVVHLTDATDQGPFPLPAATFVWRDEWAPLTAYSAFDAFTVSGSGVYLVLRDYTSATDFDAAVSDTDGPLLSLMLGIAPIPNIPVLTQSATYTPVPSEAGSYVRMVGAHDVDITVQGWDLGDVFTIRRTSGAVNFTTDTDSVINVPSGFVASLRAVGSTATIIYVGGNEWDLSGDLTAD